MIVISFNAFWKFLWLGNSTWEFFWGQILVQGFFWVLIFAPIQPSLSLESQSTPPPPGLQDYREVNRLILVIVDTTATPALYIVGQ